MNANKQDAGGLPELPAARGFLHIFNQGPSHGRVQQVDGFTRDQMLAYGESCRSDLISMLAACFRMAGADCDGNEDFRIAPRALQAVTDLRRDYDQACEELHGNGEQCRAASVSPAEIESVIERLAAEAAACITVLGRAPEAGDVRVMLDAAKLLRAISRGVPEGDTVYSLLLRASLLARGAGAESMEDEILEVMDSLWPAMSDDERKHARDYTAAIAAQRKEGA